MSLKELFLTKKKAIAEKLDDMDPGSRNLMFTLLVLVTLGGFWKAYSMNFGDAARKKSQNAMMVRGTVIENIADPKLRANNVLRGLPTNPRNTGLDDLKLAVDELKASNEKLLHKLASLEKRNDRQGARPEAGTIDLNTPLPNSTMGGASAAIPPLDMGHLKLPQDIADATLQPLAQSIEFEVARAQPKAILQEKALFRPDLTMPRGSGLGGILLTGIDAYVDTTGSRSKPNVTGSSASANLFTPFVAKVKGAAIMPNNWQNSTLTDCFVMGSAMGNLSSERAYLRAEGISCIAESGEIFEGVMDAVGFGEDGKAGIAGTVVSKQGSLLMKTFLASTVGGLANVFTPQPLNTFNSVGSGNTKQQYLWPDLAYTSQSAIAGGFSKSVEMLSQFYLDYVKQMLPVVEVIGGRRVTFILQDTLTISKFVADQQAGP